MPDRIQLRRTRGWRKPPGAVVVARPTRWGNPFTATGAVEHGFAATIAEAASLCVAEYRRWLGGAGDLHDTYDVGARTYDRRWIRANLHWLTGRDLACWCASGQPCHADVLLRLANGGAP